MDHHLQYDFGTAFPSSFTCLIRASSSSWTNDLNVLAKGENMPLKMSVQPFTRLSKFIIGNSHKLYMPKKLGITHFWALGLALAFLGDIVTDLEYRLTDLRRLILCGNIVLLINKSWQRPRALMAEKDENSMQDNQFYPMVVHNDRTDSATHSCSRW